MQPDVVGAALTDALLRVVDGIVAKRLDDRLGKPAPRATVQITIDVFADGKMRVVLWRDGQRNASYVRADKAALLRRFLPQAIDEALEFATQASSGGSVEGS